MVVCRFGDAHGSAEVTRTGRASAMSQRRFCGGGPHRAVQNQAFCRTGRPRRAVRCRKWPCGVREARLSIGGCARRWQQHTRPPTAGHARGRTIQARAGTWQTRSRREPTLGPAPPKANTLPHAQSRQGGCRFPEKMVIFVSNEYCTIQPSILLHLEHCQ